MTTINGNRHKQDLQTWLLAGIIFYVGVFTFLGGGNYPAWAEPQEGVSPAAVKAEEPEHSFLEKDDGFVYVSIERSDPFMPLMQEDIVGGGPDFQEILTGMRRFEPRQLTLVAVISKDDESVAMVEGPEGKGYLVGEGALVGRNGVITEITANRLVIQETVYARTGEKRYNHIELLLRKGEESSK